MSAPYSKWVNIQKPVSRQLRVNQFKQTPVLMLTKNNYDETIFGIKKE